jgi:hypothetical protein
MRTLRKNERKRGSALITALLVSVLLAMLGMSMMTSTMDGSKVVNFQRDEYRLTSAVESVGIIATDTLWSGYLKAAGGAAGTISSFQTYLTSAGIPDSGVGGPPTAEEGLDLMGIANIPGADTGNPEFDNVNIDAMRIVRRDDGDSTQLYVTVSASTNRGIGIVNPVLNRAIQLVYTIEPEQFDGFSYGVLANNVNCIFCHTVIDTTDRYYDTEGTPGSYDRVKVGTLESLMIRDETDGVTWNINDWDADSFIAGSLHMRGKLTDATGNLITDDWENKSFKSFEFDSTTGYLNEYGGDLHVTAFDEGIDPNAPGNNIYFDYPTDYADMPDGNLPTSFPPPFPDDGGVDEDGNLSTVGAGNKVVDPFEFAAASDHAEGAIVAGIVNISGDDVVIDTVGEYAAALFTGNSNGLQSGQTGNVVLSGTEANPIVIDGTVAIDGDVLINGYVKGEGTIICSGNIYVPTDLQYLDGEKLDANGNPTGVRTYGIAADGTKNALGLAAGGNMMLGDFLKPSMFVPQTPYQIVDGTPDDHFNFALAELALFNRGEWAKTQEFLPGHGEDSESPGSWTVPNPSYEGVGYLPRYYNFGDGDEIPIYNKGEIYFDPSTATWHGDEEVPITWDMDMLTVLDPKDPTVPELYDQTSGESLAAVVQLSPTDGWLSNEMLKASIEYFDAKHTVDTPMMIDSLLYTNNAIFGIVHRSDKARGQLQVNGSMVCADLGVLAPGRRDSHGSDLSSHPPGSPYKVGLRLNYDRRTKDMLNVKNANQVTIKRSLWAPMVNVL